MTHLPIRRPARPARFPAASLLWGACLLGLPACDDGGSAEGADATPGAADAGSGRMDAAPAPGRADAAPEPDGAPVPARDVTFAWAPPGDAPPTMFPDDAWTRDAPASRTGVRIDLGAGGSRAWIDAEQPPFDLVWPGLDGLDGWGTTASLQVAFDGPGWALDDPTRVRLVELAADGPVDIAADARGLTDTHASITPRRPLRPRARHALLLRADAACDGCRLRPSAPLAALLAGEGDARLAGRLAEALAAVGWTADDVGGALVFTTQTIHEDSLATAADIAARDYTWETPPTCEADRGLTVCNGVFTAQDYRLDGVVPEGGGVPQGAYGLEARIWLPTGLSDTPGPWPVALFGHGIAHEKGQGGGIARLLGPLGIAVVAVDAVAHGVHPDARDETFWLLDFFEVELLGADLNHRPRELRDNFRQSAWDKLQLVRLMEGNPDVDGDGAPDLRSAPDADPAWIYVGESFGGIMGIEPLALTDRFELAGLQLGGGRVASIIEFSRRFRPIKRLVDITEEPVTLARFFALVQTVLDPGDAANFAPFVLADRLPGITDARRPHTLLQLVIDDDTIPDPSSDALVRAMGLPHVPPVVLPVADTVATAPPPVASNRDGRTAGFFQYDRIRRRDGEPIEVATHDFTPSSIEAEAQLLRFVSDWRAGDPPTIIDPFEQLATPPLETIDE